MVQFAANLTMLFTEVPFLDRFERAAAAGFRAVEMLFPYDHPAEAVAERLQRFGLTLALFNMPPGDWAAGDRGMAAIPGRADEFRANLETARRYARTLGCTRLHAMAGITRGLDPAACGETFVANLRHAADLLAGDGVTVLVEPLNDRDMPGYFLAHQEDALRLVEAVDRPNVAVQLDLYHAQIMDGDLTRRIERMAGRFAHVQIASVPDRHEPDAGEVNYPHLFETLDRVGYRGWIGCEYRPRAGTEAGLSWFAPYRATR
ncbi:2-oxo-tetronate isomerase [Azospirillum thermophilum]|uniref:Hydroxypyruvate isomerase n=1 Tax=Azospirillum thermophilum TaxID=2202148 RepID=A0A2S2CY99_9PROT|nr:2-oxo-tetronate isomerase [Azospirillum thermophilum]AWK89395.1 hydroxypyruvate isomerase [Azospirillum thermophilum]